MNKNKGFIGIGLILAIVLGIVVVGGGAYYLGKSKGENKKVKIEENNLPQENQNNNTDKVSTTTNTQQIQDEANFDIEGPWPNQTLSKGCIKIKNISAPIILSPNGGEIYKAGQQITVKWNSCAPVSNNPKNTVGIFIFMASGVAGTGVELAHLTADDGSELVTLPTLSSWSDMKYGKNFKIKVWYPQYDSIASPSDSSDNTFTINSASKTISTTLPQYIGIHSDCGEQLKCWPPVIATFSESYSCNIGVAPNTEGNYVTAQRVINGRTYCINSLSDGYAGGRGYTYAYTTSNGNGIKIATFGLTYPSCGVWQGDGTSKYLNCQTEQSTFKANLDNIIDSLMFN